MTLISLDKRVGANVSDLTDLDQLMHKSGFDFEAELVRPFTPEGDEIDNKWIIRRTDSKKILGFSGNRYTPVDNHAMMEPFHRLVKTYGARYETAGVLGGGQKCWISAVLPDSFNLKNREDDEIQKRVLAFFDHTGTRRNSYLSIAHRIFCNNQLNVISRAAQKSNYSIRHVKNWKEQLIDAQLGFEAALSLHKEFEYTANKLDSIKMNEKEMRGFAVELLPENNYNVPKEHDKKISRLNRLNNRREQIVELFNKGAGNLGVSRWDALNAVTEYVDHHNQIKRVDHETRGAYHAEKRFYNGLIGGSGGNLKQRAVDLLLNTNNFKKVAELQAA